MPYANWMRAHLNHHAGLVTQTSSLRRLIAEATREPAARVNGGTAHGGPSAKPDSLEVLPRDEHNERLLMLSKAKCRSP